MVRVEVLHIGVEDRRIELPRPRRPGCARRADRRVVDRRAAGLEALPDDPQAHDVEPEGGHALYLGLGEDIGAGARHLHLVGRDLVDEIRTVQEHGPSEPAARWQDRRWSRARSSGSPGSSQGRVVVGPGVADGEPVQPARARTAATSAAGVVVGIRPISVPGQ